MSYYNQERTHSGKYCFGKTPMHTFELTKQLAREKLLETLKQEQKNLTFGNTNNRDYSPKE